MIDRPALSDAAHDQEPPDADVVIVGGGPAGLSAALWLARFGHRVVLVDSGDPRNWETRGVNGFLGQPHVRPAELRAIGREECRRWGAELVDGYVTRARREGDERFVVEYDPLPVTKAELDVRGPGAPRAPEDNAPRAGTRRLVARRLLLAFGLKDEWPRLPGLRQVYGDAAHVCPDCDGRETEGKKVLVIGNGRKGAGMALSLANWTRDIVIATNGEPAGFEDAVCAKLEALNIPVLTEPITCIHPEGSAIHSVEFADGMELDCDQIFFKIGQRPADDLAAQLGCDRDDDGQVVVDRHFHTSVYNVYAAGDIVPGPQLAIAAAGDGAIAALSIHHSLLPDALRMPPREEATAQR